MTFVGTASSQKAKDAYVPVGQGETERMTLGLNSSAWFRRDPRAMAYTAAKYLTVARLLEGTESVLEIGCGDGFGAPIIAQAVDWYLGIDFYAPHIQDAQALTMPGNVEFAAMDILNGPPISEYDAVFALDVLEHIDPEQEWLFLRNAVAYLKPPGVFVCGMPTLNSQNHASAHGRAGHINCQHPEQITATLRNYFHNVFSFGMSDGQINTGFEPMRQYQLNLCAGVRL